MATGFSASRILYMRKTLTRGTIQKMTGIHWKTQEAVIRGTRFLSLDQKSRLQSGYGKTAYKNMRTDGFSVKQASRYRSYSPYTVDDKQLEFEKRVKEIAKNSIMMKYNELSTTEIKKKLFEETAKYEENIKWANYNSDHDFEYFIEHGT